MILLDSNIVIYAVDPKNEFLLEFIESNFCQVSIISKIEVLGYHLLSTSDRKFFTDFFKTNSVLEINNEIAETAVQLRQNMKLSLGDAIIASTALVHNLKLITRNTMDFQNIKSLKLINPFKN